MAPVKFGDLQKPVTEVLDDDYQTSGYQLKVKHATSLKGTTCTTAVDLWPAKDAVKTPAKITWKYPTPFGLKGISADKLEMNKSGDFATEFAFTEPLHSVKGLSLSVKSDLKNVDKASVGATFTGFGNTRIQFDTKATKPDDFVFEMTGAVPHFTHALTLGAKMTKKDPIPSLGVRFTPDIPSLGARFAPDPIFGALIASDKLSKYTAHALFKIKKDLKVAAKYEHPSKGTFSVGVLFEPRTDMKLKAKYAVDGTISASLKTKLAKDITCLVGGKYNVKAKTNSFGLQVSIE